MVVHHSAGPHAELRRTASNIPTHAERRVSTALDPTTGSLLALIGLAMLVIGIAQPPLRYPRSYLIAGSLPLIAFVLALPLAPPPYHRSLIGLLGFVELGLAALIMHRHIEPGLPAAEGETDADN